MKVASNIEFQGNVKVSPSLVSNYVHSLVLDAQGNIKKTENLSALTTYQIADIFAQYYGIIALNTFIGNELGSYNCRLEAEFGDLSNGSYRLAAKRVVDFSFIAYQSGATVVHSEPSLIVSSHSGTIVRLSDNAVFDLKADDIDFETSLSSSKLLLKIKNNIGSSSIPAANGSIRCLYTLKINKWNWTSGGTGTGTEID